MAYILVVDDELAVRDALRVPLEREGYEVEEAQDGKEALLRFADCSADLVIADAYMDGMDGIEFLRRVRKTWPEARVLIMGESRRSGGLLLLDVAKALGAVSTLGRPFEEEELLAVVAQILYGDE